MITEHDILIALEAQDAPYFIELIESWEKVVHSDAYEQEKSLLRKLLLSFSDPALLVSFISIMSVSSETILEQVLTEHEVSDYVYECMSLISKEELLSIMERVQFVRSKAMAYMDHRWQIESHQYLTFEEAFDQKLSSHDVYRIVFSEDGVLHTRYVLYRNDSNFVHRTSYLKDALISVEMVEPESEEDEATSML